MSSERFSIWNSFFFVCILILGLFSCSEEKKNSSRNITFNNRKIIWKKELDGTFNGYSKGAFHRGYVYGTDEKGYLYKYSSNGERVWKKKVLDGTIDNPILYSGTRFYFSGNKSLICGDTKNGEILWRSTLSKDGYGSAASSCSIYGGIIIVQGSGFDYLYGVRATNGKILWKKHIKTEAIQYFPVSKGLVLVIDDKYRLIGIDIKSGTIVWKQDKYKFIRPTFSPNYAIAQTKSKKLTIIDRKEGNIVQSKQFNHMPFVYYQFQKMFVVTPNKVFVFSKNLDRKKYEVNIPDKIGGKAAILNNYIFTTHYKKNPKPSSVEIRKIELQNKKVKKIDPGNGLIFQNIIIGDGLYLFTASNYLIKIQHNVQKGNVWKFPGGNKHRTNKSPLIYKRSNRYALEVLDVLRKKGVESVMNRLKNWPEPRSSLFEFYTKSLKFIKYFNKGNEQTALKYWDDQVKPLGFDYQKFAYSLVQYIQRIETVRKYLKNTIIKIKNNNYNNHYEPKNILKNAGILSHPLFKAIDKKVYKRNKELNNVKNMVLNEIKMNWPDIDH